LAKPGSGVGARTRAAVGFWRPTHRSRGFICGQRASSVDALCAMHRATQQQHRAMPIRGSRSSGYGQHAWARRNRQEMCVHLAGRRNSWPHRSAMWQEDWTTMWCVRACDASSQQYLEEEAGYGQADCSIMPGTHKLHGPASHWAPRELMPLVFSGTLATRTTRRGVEGAAALWPRRYWQAPTARRVLRSVVQRHPDLRVTHPKLADDPSL